MNICSMSVLLANICLVYTLACLYYIFFTRNLGTPFKKSLYDFQKKIKEESANKRRNIFIQGIVIAAIILAFTQPFRECLQD